MEKSEELTQVFESAFTQVAFRGEENIDPLAKAAIHNALEDLFMAMMSHLASLKTKSYKLIEKKTPYAQVADLINDHQKKVMLELAELESHFGSIAATPDNFMNLDSNFATAARGQDHQEYYLDFTESQAQSLIQERHLEAIDHSFDSTKASSGELKMAKFGPPALGLGEHDLISLKAVYCISPGDSMFSLKLHGKEILANLNMYNKTAKILKHNLPSIINFRRVGDLEVYFAANGQVFAFEKSKCVYKCPVACRRHYKPIEGLNYVFSSKGVAASRDSVYFIDSSNFIRKLVVADLKNSIENNVEYTPQLLNYQAVDLVFKASSNDLICVSERGELSRIE